MNVRRSAAALAAVTVVLGAAVPAVAATPSPAASPTARPAGLYGTSDPTYDGVWRQSLALLAQHTVGVTPADEAVAWLTGQQCANGAFAAFRADPAGPCDAKLMTDTNSTAAAVQALAALGGHRAAAEKAVGWLKSVQNSDGGWGYSAGGASDANSTAVVAGALAAAGQQPAQVQKAGKSPLDALGKLSLPCSGDGGGAFAYQPDKKGALAANADATAAGVLGALGEGFAATAGKTSAPPVCGGTPGALTPADLARNGAAHLVGAVAATGYLTSSLPGAADQPDYGNTADAVVALAAQGAVEQAEKPLAWLRQNAAAWAKQSGPAAYAQLIFAAHATGADPRAFGRTDLVAQLDATGPTPQATAKAGDRAAGGDTADAEKKDDSGSGYSVWLTVGVFLVAGIGIGFLLSARGRGRGRKQQP
ncbi:prenyltransferase/squalene oxidase repeat-containing protein [Streptomyces sp. NPDC054884]|uniref:prenyltransferase/squalene oxidase repeat-containing protein n=1 Tax=Streptomyces sp. ME08-AFT2 TaxID=3028683 RepID=UPI0029A086A6|nr:prenyltransferase/squalene oxidase repeat-containing protein [Streptomyces sp. ME08-AFT2]MDX3312305.1 prenyltransferase/squalene oxidase repeat-containing protein [Streptomyces sp. ME08-AFT2]